MNPLNPKKIVLEMNEDMTTAQIAGRIESLFGKSGAENIARYILGTFTV